ncbi:molybdopterin-dependent oxidoreductase, partial [Streptomyces sp. NPDC001215]
QVLAERLDVQRQQRGLAGRAERQTDVGGPDDHTGYTANLPLADLTGGRAWIAFEYDGRPLPAEHGGPARLVVPHLYFWKSAKWIAGLRILDHDEPGFWEQNGYHARGNPWEEQRYSGD